MTLVLGIETSFDDTGVALYDSQFGLLFSINSSCTQRGCYYGGIVPQLTALEHAKHIASNVRKVITRSHKRQVGVETVSCTNTPGLVLSLTVGISMATTLAFVLGAKIASTKHTKSHIISVELSRSQPQLPFISLVISGKTTALYYIASMVSVLRIKSTKDDSVGEVLDKIARALSQQSNDVGGLLMSQMTHRFLTKPREHAHWADNKQ